MSIFIGALVWILLSQAAVAQTVNLRYGQAYSAIRSIFSLPVSVAEREGFFRREGLNFRLVVPIPGGSDKMIDAFHDDTCDVTHGVSYFIERLNAGDKISPINYERRIFLVPVFSLPSDIDRNRVGQFFIGSTHSCFDFVTATNGKRSF